MKVKQSEVKVFKPVTLTLETRAELCELLHVLGMLPCNTSSDNFISQLYSELKFLDNK